MRLARLIGWVGKLLIWLGTIVLLFVAYQLWGTGLAEARAQNDLEDDFSELVERFEVQASTVTVDATTTSTTEIPADYGPTTITAPTTTLPPPPPDDGDAVARIVIPRIGVDKIVVEGISRSDLRKGPGHYPGTPMPGQPGNAAIAGHRTTYGQPFFDIDQLEPGDEIFVTTLQGVFRYVVMGHEIVEPTRVDVIEDQGDDRLTLTSCHPKFSAAQRIIVTASLEDIPAPPTTTTTTTTTAPDDELAGSGDTTTTTTTVAALDSLDGADGQRAGPAVLWGSVTFGVWLAFYALSRVWRRMPAYLLGAPVFGVTLFVFFGALSQLLPSNF